MDKGLLSLWFFFFLIISHMDKSPDNQFSESLEVCFLQVISEKVS